MSTAKDARDVAVGFRNVSRHFNTVRAVDNVSLEVYDKEFFSMLGPSGSGKTTCLRLIAGFEQPTSGSIQLYGQEVSGIPPYDREVNTVFQDYALFPHMTVEDNIAYGLMVRKVDKQERQKRVGEMLELVQLSNLGKRRPSELSGGQRQRVALARALINHPRVLLLDEPLGALDLKLRQAMQLELKNIQDQVGITFIYVTHDQEEALTMSDRIAVFNEGKIEQIDSPSEIYDNPQTVFVAGFVGTSNIIMGSLAELITGEKRPFSIRPEKISLLTLSDEVAPDMFSVKGTVRDITYLGMYMRYLLDLGEGNQLIVAQQNFRDDARSLSIDPTSPIIAAWPKNTICHLSV
jgi:putative spermidine/putrescine transport system ATP-binding protein